MDITVEPQAGPARRPPTPPPRGDSWPPPPSDRDLREGSIPVTSSDSLHVPPPPPPRWESLRGADNFTHLSDNYSDPYDSLSVKDRGSDSGDYQDPLDCVQPELGKTAQCSTQPMPFQSHNDEPDTSLYSKPVVEKRLKKEDLEEMYSKPLKRLKTQNDTIGEVKSELYNEIMDHLKNKDLCQNATEKSSFKRKPDPDYATIEECLLDSVNSKKMEPVLADNNAKFANLSKAKKRTVMAASTEKIYETYLSFGRKNKVLHESKQTKSLELGSGLQPLNARCRSQPDVSTGEGLQVVDIDLHADDSFRDVSQSPLSTFKPTNKNRNPNTQRSLLEKCQSYEDGLGDLRAPGTPTIMATPSFDSLYSVNTSHSQQMARKSGSAESLSSSETMSTSTTSSLSYGPHDKSGSLQSLQSEKSLSPVKEEEEMYGGQTVTSVASQSHRADERLEKEAYRTGIIPLTPGKLSALKHGIDFSNYLLKPIPQQTQAEATDSGNYTTENKENRSEINFTKFEEKHSKLAIKETLSGVRTKVEPVKPGMRKEMERRHTVQTVSELHPASCDRPGVPGIGVASRGRARREVAGTRDNSTDRAQEPSSKRHCREPDDGTRPGGYLETDLDIVATDKPRVLMKKSKSHSGFESGVSTVVTDIW